MPIPSRGKATKRKSHRRDDDDDDDNDEESEYKQPSDDESGEEFQLNDGDNKGKASEQKVEDIEDKTSPPIKRETAPKKNEAAPPKKRRRKKVVYNSDSDDEQQYLPTEFRKTKAGGYAHTNRSRARISKANTGNTPWNKGRKRSEADKAKISAAVRLRNRAILMAKLEKFNMTEEEFRAKKKEIKHLRERVRRAKVASQSKEQQLDQKTLEMQRELDRMIADRDKVVNTKTEPVTKAAMQKLQNSEKGDETQERPPIEETPSQVNSNETKHDNNIIHETNHGDEVNPDEITHDNDQQEKSEQINDLVKSMVSSIESAQNSSPTCKASSPAEDTSAKSLLRDKKISELLSRYSKVAWKMEWTPEEFDSKEPSCPNGGFGGLVCCEDCTAAYSNYMTATVQEMETNRLESVSGQVEELLGYIEESRMQLMVATQTAQLTAPPPPPPKGDHSLSRSRKAARDMMDPDDPDSALLNWTVSSTLDMSSFGPRAARI